MDIPVHVVYRSPRPSDPAPTAVLVVLQSVDAGLNTLDHLGKVPQSFGLKRPTDHGDCIMHGSNAQSHTINPHTHTHTNTNIDTHMVTMHKHHQHTHKNRRAYLPAAAEQLLPS